MTAGPGQPGGEWNQPPQGQGPPQGYGPGPGGYPSAPQGSYGQAGPAPARPQSVVYGVGAFVANFVLGLLSSLLTFGGVGTATDQALRDAGIDPASAEGQALADSAGTTTAVVAILFVVIGAAILWFAWQGKNWARIVLFVLGGLSLFFGVIGLFAGLGFGILSLLSIVQLMLIAVGIYFLAQKSSSQWYAASKQRP